MNTEYEKGFLDALERVVFMGDQLWAMHFKNSKNESLSESDQMCALNSTMTIGNFISHIKCLGASVARKQVEIPVKIVHDRHWWSSEDGKGKN